MLKVFSADHLRTTLLRQFGSNGNLEQHGFARNRLWTIDDNSPPLPVNPSIKAFVDIILKPNEDDLKIWPHRFVLEA
jgi:glucose-6-phosphate 1-epimerase